MYIYFYFKHKLPYMYIEINFEKYPMFLFYKTKYAFFIEIIMYICIYVLCVII